MQRYELLPTADAGFVTFCVNFPVFCVNFVLIWVIRGSDPLMIQGAGNSVFLAGFRWGNAVYLSGSRGSYQGVTREIPGRYPLGQSGLQCPAGEVR